MRKKDIAKKRRKRLERALGVGGCDHCKNLSPFLSRTGTEMNTYLGRCASCNRLLLLETNKFDTDPEIFGQYIQCVGGEREVCTHALTIKVNGEITREDPPCDCGKARVVLQTDLHTKEGDDRESIKSKMVSQLEEKFEGLHVLSDKQSSGDAPSAGE